MVPKFLEFWGKAMLAAARGENQLGETAQCFSQGIKGAQDISRRVARLYGLAPDSDEKAAASSPEWRQTSESFMQSFRQFLDLLEVVPRSDHEELEKKYASLQEKYEQQQENIDRLEKLLAEKVTGGEAASGFQKLMQAQSRQFQDLMDALTGRKS